MRETTGWYILCERLARHVINLGIAGAFWGIANISIKMTVSDCLCFEPSVRSSNFCEMRAQATCLQFCLLAYHGCSHSKILGGGKLNNF